MKLSDKVLLTFFGGITVYMIAAFTEIRLKGDSDQLDPDKALVEKYPLDNCKYLVVNDLNYHRPNVGGFGG